MLKFLIIGIAIGSLVAAIVQHVRGWSATGPRERAFAIRFAAFSWLAGLLFLAAFIYTPGVGRLILMVPGFLLAVSMARWWKKSRARLRQEEGGGIDFERMKRVN
jgi:hypothetical protein